MAVTLNLVCYNVLSSHLADAEHFAHCDPSNLEASTRLERVIQKLDGHVAACAVICLQEVSRCWEGKLQAFFQQRGYTFITSLYGSSFNGYMGVGLAFPNCRWLLLDADIQRLSETKCWPADPDKPRTRNFTPRPGDWTCPMCNELVFASKTECYKCNAPKPKSTMKDYLLSCFPCGAFLTRPARRIQPAAVSPAQLYLAKARGKDNTLIAVHLQSTEQAEQCVWIGCYHMPCAFREPQLMVMHAALAIQQVQRLAITTKSPCIVAGDWNTKPGDEAYRLITTGDIMQNSDAYPVVVEADNWKPKLQFPMYSAYCKHHGREPDFTNFAQVEESEPFIDTLDYIFCSPQLRVCDAPALPHRDSVAGPLPIASEPSDHILLAATLEIPADSAELTAALYGDEVVKKMKTGKRSYDDAQEKLREAFAVQLLEFMCSEEQVMCFPTNLDSYQRGLVHQLADELGLLHTSCGEGPERFLRIEKTETLPAGGKSSSS
eukprot:TRINITY_DN89958_c0_g1_i1.p1 TRINITY_DN89958_c0_g1~~TRINITY_DN89958_c0_g1_i1.p1  ORF type:complete len:491 (+),score=68.58 TRINITY_DN89958_c0_g1_i1:22-1494(+)